MSGDVEILKEYLLSLGFHVDEKSTKTFDGSVKKLDFNAGKLAGSLLGVATAAQLMVASFSRSMEKLYYSSQKADSAAGNIQALDYAGKQIGLGAGTMQSALEGMARAMRTNPGLRELVESFGIPVKGRDMADVAKDFLKTLGRMDHMVGAQFASLFGIDSDTLFLITKHADEFERMERSRKQMAKDAGLDMEAATKAGKEYAQQLNEIIELFGILKGVAALALLEPMKDAAAVLKLVLHDWIRIIKEMKESTAGNFFGRIYEGLFGSKRQGVTLTPEAAARASGLSTSNGARAAIPGAPAASAPPMVPQGGSDPAARLAALEARYGLPRGLLDRVWAKESNRGKNKGPSTAGALGDFQFMKGTWGEWGSGGDINSFQDSSLAAARYLANLSRKYNGDVTKMLAAYNWGQGNVDRKGLAAMPWETRDYVKIGEGLTPVNVQSKTDIIVHGSDPATTAKLVAGGQEQAAKDIARNVSKVALQ